MINKSKITVGNNLKYIRTIYKISVKEFATFLEMSENNYHKIERNEIGLSFMHASKIADLIGISLDVLIKDDAINLAHHINEKGDEIIKQNLETIKSKLKNAPL
ncbi:MAG: helix-turn-helix transcriptional regulator [Bacteroidota bacterium]